ncbi:YicC/YloC family endoribonuclease [Halobacteriovorax sp. JY17]|uniref:YicC/YloC family endoribonuclease n=1 Tax=Halobacteriovorax sp. JY17 TaxID=2014617 RepID=UPI000C3AA989|nr:YicC/YloC family endoribonuclease [Halobacteriovorax sp. JY17]PIK14813.1 MAG: YicC family protein [Halobacteriovorax sp. JY17]
MAIQSMTGFGKGEASGDDWVITAEIKSVNHRFKDLRFKMSSLFAPIEIDLKNRLTEVFKRGSFDIYINYKKAEGKTKFDDIDEEKVSLFLGKISKIVKNQGLDLAISPSEFLRQDFYKDLDDSSEESFDLARTAFVNAMESLKESRLSEGDKMLKVIKSHKEQFEKHYSVIVGLADTFQENVEERLRKRFQDFSEELGVDEPRFLQEVVYYLEKMDVHEEINRIAAHLEKLDSILVNGGEIGRQLDFLIQELNRETNTIGSKSSLKEISDNVVQMKVQLEKIREQGLNLE